MPIRVSEGFEDEFPGAGARSTECFLNVALLGTAMLASLNRYLETFGVPSYNGLNALAVLGGAGAPLPPSEVAARMIATRPAVSGILGTLERRGLVQRIAHHSDGRMHLVALTPAGQELAGRVLPEVHRFEQELFGVLDHQQLTALLGTLDTLIDRLESMGPPTADPGRRSP